MISILLASTSVFIFVFYIYYREKAEEKKTEEPEINNTRFNFRNERTRRTDLFTKFIVKMFFFFICILFSRHLFLFLFSPLFCFQFMWVEEERKGNENASEKKSKNCRIFLNQKW